MNLKIQKIKTHKNLFLLYITFVNIFKKKIMKNIEKIKLEAFMEFLKRLEQHGKCMDIVPHNVDYENIKIPKQK